MLALVIYCFVAIAAAGFAPLELDPSTDKDGDNIPDDANRYDFTFTYNESTGLYDMETLYNRGYENWVGETSSGDAEFRNNFQEFFPDPDYSVGDAGESSIGKGLLVCLFILIMVALLGAGMMFIQKQEMGWMGVLAIVFLIGVGVVGASFLAGQAETNEKEVLAITEADAASIVSNFENANDHRFSIIFVGGPDSNISGKAEVGDRHPTQVDQGGPIDWWPKTVREYLWAPLGISVSMQWIILGMFVGIAMGSAGAQARSMFTKLIPETRTSEFFGFFGFLGKSAAMIGTFLYGIASSLFDSRVAILSITLVILAGTFLTSRVDLEEGIRVAEEEDARNRGQIPE